MTQPPGSVSRRLAVVVFADIARFTDLAAADEDRAVRFVRAFQGAARAAIQRHHGRLVKFIGDAALAEFTTTEDAVRGAASLVEEFGRQARSVGPPPPLRVGIHLGEIVTEPDGDIYGDGVNIAARLQEAADPGQIVVSGEVWRQLGRRAGFSFAPLGERELQGLNAPIEIYAVEGIEEVGASPSEPETERRPILGRPRRVVLTTGVLAAVLIAGGWAAWRWWPSSETVVSSEAIAVMPFSVHGSEEYTYLGEGMVSLLSTKLDGAGDLRSVDPRALLSRVSQLGGPVTDPSEGKNVAEQFGAGWYVMGDILEVGGRIRLDAILYDGRTGQRVGDGTAEGSADEIFSMVDHIATQLLGNLKGGPAARVDKIAAVTTSSLPALKAYLEGQSALRRDDFAAAVQAFQYAVAADSLFALGYYRLSIAAEWLLRNELAQESAQRAFQNADRLAERDRKLLDAFSTFRRGETDAAETLYRTLVTDYPDDVEAWLYLGELQFHTNPIRGRSPSEAREAFSMILRFEPSNTAALVHLARIAALERHGEEVVGYVQRYIALTPSADRLYPMRSLKAFSGENAAERDSVISALERASGETIVLVIWDVAIFAGDVTGAERITRHLTASWRPTEERAVGSVYLAFLLLAQGRLDAARQELGRAEALDPAMGLEYRALLASLSFVPTDPDELRAIREELSRFDAVSVPDVANPVGFFNAHNGLHPLFREYLLGLVSARLGDGQRAEAHASRTSQTAAPEIVGSLPADLANAVRAHLLWNQDRYGEALETLEGARYAIPYNPMISSPIISVAYERFARAELLHAMDRDREALDWYRNLVSTSVSDVVYLALSHFRQGQILEKGGQGSAASQHYAAFLDLWRGADPEFRSLRDEAERGLERLATSRPAPAPAPVARRSSRGAGGR